MTLEEIYAIPMNGNGWRVLPNGNWLHIGTNVKSEIDLAEIGSYAKIGSGAEIGSYAKLAEKSVHEKSPLAVQGSRHLAGNYQTGMIQVGCQLHTFEFWLANYETIGQEAEYSEAEIKEYKAIIDFLVANGK